eukprot:1151014-Pelagomonas_calceolata.AAC.3
MYEVVLPPVAIRYASPKQAASLGPEPGRLLSVLGTLCKKEYRTTPSFSACRAHLSLNLVVVQLCASGKGFLTCKLHRASSKRLVGTV